MACMGQPALQQLLVSQGSLQMLSQEHWVPLSLAAGCRLQAPAAAVLHLACSGSQWRLQRQQGGWRLLLLLRRCWRLLLLRRGWLLLLLRLGRQASRGEGKPAAAPGRQTHMLLPAEFLAPPGGQTGEIQCLAEVHSQGLLRMQMQKAVLLRPGEQATSLQPLCKARMAACVMQLPHPHMLPLRCRTV